MHLWRRSIQWQLILSMGTALLVSTANPSRHFFSLVVARAKGKAVVITAIHDDGERFMVRLEWQGQHVDVEIVGGDQPA